MRRECFRNLRGVNKDIFRAIELVSFRVAREDKTVPDTSINPHQKRLRLVVRKLFHWRAMSTVRPLLVHPPPVKSEDAFVRWPADRLYLDGRPRFVTGRIRIMPERDPYATLELGGWGCFFFFLGGGGGGGGGEFCSWRLALRFPVARPCDGSAPTGDSISVGRPSAVFRAGCRFAMKQGAERLRFGFFVDHAQTKQAVVEYAELKTKFSFFLTQIYPGRLVSERRQSFLGQYRNCRTVVTSSLSSSS